MARAESKHTGGTTTGKPLLSLLLPLIFALVAALIALATWWSAEQQVRAVDQQLRRSLLRNAVRLAADIHPATALALTFTATDRDEPAYMDIGAKMQAFGQLLPGVGIYSIQRRGQSLVFGPENYPPANPLASARGAIYGLPPPEALAIFDDARPVVFGPHTDEYGTFITALAPVRDRVTGDILMVVGLEMLDVDWAAEVLPVRIPIYWVGGALLLVLLLGGVALMMKFRAVGSMERRLRHAETIFVAVFGLAFSMALGAWVLVYEQRERTTAFEALADTHAEAARQLLARINSKLRSAQKFFEASEWVDAEEFHHIAEAFIEASPLVGLGWIPGPDGPIRDPAADRGAAQAEPLIAWGRAVDGTEGRTSVEDPIHPAVYWHRREDAPDLLGFDHGHEPDLLALLNRTAPLPGHTHAAPLPTGITGDERPRLLVCRALTLPDVFADRGPRQDGWIVGLVDLQILLQQAVRELATHVPLIDVRLADATLGRDWPYARYPQPVRAAPAVDRPSRECPHDGPARYLQLFSAFGRPLALSACPTPAFAVLYPVRIGYLIAGAGWVLTALLTVLAGQLRRRARNAELARSEAKYRRLFEAMSSGFALHKMIYDAAGNAVDYRFIEVNPAFEKQTGLKARELIGRTLHDVMPDSEPFWLQRYAKVVQSGRSDRFEHYGVELDRHFEVTAYRPAPGHFAVLVTDITLRKRYEEQLARWRNLLELLMQLATRFINLPTDQSDVATRTALEEVALFNRADRAYLFEYDWENKTLTNTHEWCAEGIPSLLHTLQQVPMSTYAEGTACHRRGEPYHVPDVAAMADDHPSKAAFLEQGIRSLMTIPLMTEEGCIGFIGFDAVRARRHWVDEEMSLLSLLAKLLTNVRLRKGGEEERLRLEMKMQQSQKLESLGLLAGGIAHDFNNILTTVLGNADLALQDISPVSPAREPLEAIEVGARRAADLCRQMLAYAGRGRFVVETFSVNELIEEMLHLLKTSISKRALFNLHLEPQLPPVQGDVSQIRQILLNLVINASEALQEKSGTISLHTGVLNCDQDYLTDVLFETAIEPGLYVVAEVADTGCGMDKETLASIFDPFFTTKFTGRGLGLSAVMGIVRGHKGTLKVYSEKSKGSVFKLLLPAAQEEITDATPSAAGEPPTAWQGSGTILLVDDEASIRTLATRILERFGFDVLTASDGIEALELYTAHRDGVAAIILDLTMPRKGGEETLHDLRKQDATIPIIIASGYSKDELHDRLAVKGVTAFVQKPFNSKSLRETLSRIMSAGAADGGKTP